MYEVHYSRIAIAEMGGILKLTGCKKPCFYKKYDFVGDKRTTGFPHDDFVLSLWAVSNSSSVETEVFVYPWTSLVAEFGGTLGTQPENIKLNFFPFIK